MKRLLQSPDTRVWLAVVGSATLVLGAAYGMVQQSTRLAANESPLAAIQSAKTLIEKGAAPESAVPNANINIRTNDNLFIIVTDREAKLLAGSAFLDDRVPLPPRGVFDYTKTHGLDKVTWEPAAGVRLATVVSTYKTASGSEGFIVVGQSLRSVEERIKTSTLVAVAAWLAAIAWATLVLLLPRLDKKTK
ncbi:MAG: hypothetical protein WD887_00710 [Candidatus Saccharimonadales bacterium]